MCERERQGVVVSVQAHMNMGTTCIRDVYACAVFVPILCAMVHIYILHLHLLEFVSLNLLKISGL